LVRRASLHALLCVTSFTFDDRAKSYFQGA